MQPGTGWSVGVVVSLFLRGNRTQETLWSASGMCPLADTGGWTLNKSSVCTSVSIHLLHEPFLIQNHILLVASLNDRNHTEMYVVLAMYNMQEIKSGTKPRHLY